MIKSFNVVEFQFSDQAHNDDVTPIHKGKIIQRNMSEELAEILAASLNGKKKNVVYIAQCGHTVPRPQP